MDALETAVESVAASTGFSGVVRVDRGDTTVPVQDLSTTEAYVAVLGGRAAKFAPGVRFAYCNSGGRRSSPAGSCRRDWWPSSCGRAASNTADGAWPLAELLERRLL